MHKAQWDVHICASAPLAARHASLDARPALPRAAVDDLWNAGGATPKDEAARVKYAKEVAPKFLDALAARYADPGYWSKALEEGDEGSLA